MLTIEPTVEVRLSIGTSNVSNNTFSVGAILGPSSVLKTAGKRFATYNSLEEVAQDFGPLTPEYLAAKNYFGVSPAPEALVIAYYDTDEANPETPLVGLVAAVAAGMDFYGLYYCPAENESDANIKTYCIALDEYLRNAKKAGVLFYGVVGTAQAVTADGGLLQTFYSAKSMRAVGFVCKESINEAAAVMGLAMGYAADYQYAAFALAYKRIACLDAKDVTQADVNLIRAINGNVYVQRGKSIYCFEIGATASGMRFDEILYIDRISNDIQNATFNTLANSETKLPQNDSTSQLFISDINRALENYYAGGVLTDAAWRGTQIGNINTGDVLEHGYAVYADPFDEQSADDRAARKSMPIYVLIQLSGAVESVVLMAYVQR